MDASNILEDVTATAQRICSEAIRVLYAYPIFLVALGAIALYAFIQCLSSCREACADYMYDYLEQQHLEEKKMKKQMRKAEKKMNQIKDGPDNEQSKELKQPENSEKEPQKLKNQIKEAQPSSAHSKKKKGKAKGQTPADSKLLAIKYEKDQPQKKTPQSQASDGKAQRFAAIKQDQDGSQEESSGEPDAQKKDQERKQDAQPPKKLKLPQKYLEKLFYNKSDEKSEGTSFGFFGGNRNVRMVDSETQTDDELLEALLMDKLREVYERQKAEEGANEPTKNEKANQGKTSRVRAKMNLDFTKV